MRGRGSAKAIYFERGSRGTELEKPRLVAPEERDVIDIEEPSESKEDRATEKGPEEQADGESARERDVSARRATEEQSAGDADTGGENDAGEGSDKALFPGGGRKEEGRVQQIPERKNAEEKGEHSAEIQEHGKPPARRGRPARSRRV